MADEKKKETALATVDAAVPDKVLTQQERLALANAEDQYLMMQEGMILQAKLVDLALKSTTEADWDDMGAKRAQRNGQWEIVPFSGTPRLNASGARKIRRLAQLQVETFGSVMVEVERDPETKQLLYFCYECKGRVTSSWAPPADCVGRCDSDNQFHSTRWKGGKKTKLPADQVNRVNIAQQAQTLCITRGVTEYLSLSNLTWEQVQKYTNVDPSAAPKTAATFAQPQDKPDTPPPPDDPPPPGDADATQNKPSVQQITAIKRMAKDAGIARDPVSWWEFIEKTAGAEFSISETQDEAAAYGCWTSDVAEKLKAEIVKRRNDE